MTTNSLDKTTGVAQLEKAVATIDEVIKRLGGSLMIKMKPRAVSEHDDIELVSAYGQGWPRKRRN